MLHRGMDPGRRYNTMFTLTIEEVGKAARIETAILADWDVDPLGAGLRHVDLLRVEPSAEIEREIPVTYVGRAVGTSTGGRLKTFQRSVRVRAPAGSVPPELTVDVTPLQGGQYLRVKDVTLSGGRVVGSPELPLAYVETAKAEEAPAADAKPKK
jgi:large subunit ribosomal protein L25